jgi:hypothetical protein
VSSDIIVARKEWKIEDEPDNTGPEETQIISSRPIGTSLIPSRHTRIGQKGNTEEEIELLDNV